MGKIRTGILGGFSGKVGTVIGASWRTLDVMRSLPKKTSKPPVRSQIDQRKKFGLITGFLGAISEVVSKGYQSGNKLSGPMNEAVKFNLKEAISGVSPLFTINYAKLKLTLGKLDIPQDLLAVPVSGRKVAITWAYDPLDFNTENERLERSTDRASIIIYDETNDYFLIPSTAVRTAGKLEARMLSKTIVGNTLHCWFYISSLDGKKVSTSVYLGPIKAIA